MEKTERANLEAAGVIEDPGRGRGGGREGERKEGGRGREGGREGERRREGGGEEGGREGGGGKGRNKIHNEYSLAHAHPKLQKMDAGETKSTIKNRPRHQITLHRAAPWSLSQ